MTNRTAVFFIAEGAHLTAQAILLAASLRHHHGARDDLIAYVPSGADPIPDAAMIAFETLGVVVTPLAIDPTVWKSNYPHGNKIFACRAPRNAARHVFLDSDMVCVAPLDFESVIQPGAVTVVPEGTPTWGKTGDRWARVYAFFGLPMPTERVRLVRRRRIEFLPYFNAGMVGFCNDTNAKGQGFGDMWLETAMIIDRDVAVGGKRPWVDQISLPISLKRMGLAYNALPDVWNFSISDRALEPEARPRLIHYHSFRFGPVWPQFTAELDHMVATFGPDLMARLTPHYGEHWFRKPNSEAVE
ncbi:hypothetical protein [Oceaniglobus ichthyenteri]|uniref:hypothetical protein n=1 Tax=Oceaniglobus ichthyenteri TaxID=2136177 RepID=UPI000D34C921|nr:hypothetical protein [Oceaniglobus ichthyenteri]